MEKILRECEHTQAAAQSEFKEAAMEIQKLEETVEQGKNEIIELLNLRASTKGKLQRYDAMMEQISIRKVELNQRHLRLNSDSVQLESSEEQYQAEKAEIEETIEKLIREGNRCEDKIKKYQAEISRSTQQLEVGQTAYHREASRLESLR